jgi:DNA-3-methyladenine glycosylase I
VNAPAPGSPVVGPDGLARCPWGLSAPEYVLYHDTEWGRPQRGDDQMFERLTLEAFQSGLSWLTILRKRDAFRAAFAGFSIPAVARFGPADEERLLADAGIVRNRAKIAAALTNARVADALPGGLSELVWSFAPPVPGPAPRTTSDLRPSTPESAAMARGLKRAGFVFVGPTTAHALMQATGMVDDHLLGCHARGAETAAASGARPGRRPRSGQRPGGAARPRR